MNRRILIFVMFTIALSLLFSYENKFSFSKSAGSNKISLSHSPEFTEISGGYTRIAKMGDGHTTEPGIPELPHFSTYFQLDPTKTYELQFEVLESYTIEDITILPHQGMEKWEVDVVSIINEEIYDSYEPFPQENMIVSNRSQGRGIEFISIYDGIFPKKLWYAGAAEAIGDLSILSTYPSNPGGATEAFIAWSNLIGDPALHLWTGIPTNSSELAVPL